MVCGSSLKGAQRHQGAQISLQTHIQVFASAIPPPESWAAPPTLWNSDFFKCILLYMDICHHCFLPHYHLHHREHKNSHDIPQEMQKISIKLHSDSVSSSALHKFLKVLGEKSSGYTREGGKNRSKHQPSPETPQSSLNGAAAAEFMHWLHQELLVAVSVPITSLDQWFC